MKRMIIGLACLWPAIAASQDQAADTAAAVRVTGVPERISLPPQHYNVWYDEFHAIAGDYTLSNGAGMSLSMWGNRMYVRIGQEAPLQLVAVSPYVFVGRAQPIKIVVQDPDMSNDNRINATVLLPADRLTGSGSGSGSGGEGAYTLLLAHR